MRMRQLNSFIRACELGSITRAAVELNVAQPALGLQIRNLEAEFGDQLLIRTAHGVVPTAAGELVLSWAREVLKSTEELRGRIKAMGSAAPSILNFGLTIGLADEMPALLTRSVADQIPGLELRVIEAYSHDIIHFLRREQIHMGLTFETEAPPGYEATPMLAERLCYISRCNGESGPIELAEVLSRPLTLPPPRSSVREAVETAARSIGARVNCRSQLSSIQTAKNLASCGLSGTILPFGSVQDIAGTPGISVRLVVAPVIERFLYLIQPRNRQMNDIDRSLRRILDQSLAAMVRKNSDAKNYWIVPDRFGEAA